MKVKMTNTQHNGCMSMLGIWFIVGGIGSIFMSFTQKDTVMILLMGIITSIIGLSLYLGGKR